MALSAITAGEFRVMNEKPARGTSLFSWLILILTLLAGLGGLVLFVLNRETAVPVSWGTAGGPRDNPTDWYNFLQGALIVPVVAVIFGLLIVSRQLGRRIGWLLLLIGLISGFQALVSEWAIFGYYTAFNALPGYGLAAWFTNWTWVALFAALLGMVAVFPNGHFLSLRWQWLTLTGIFFMTFPLFVGAIIETPMSSAFQIPNPFVTTHPSGLYNLLFTTGVPFMPLSSLVVLVTVLIRYRRGHGRERQQIKWLLSGVAAMVAMIIVGLVMVMGWESAVGGIIVNSAVLAPLFGIGVAMLRHQLYDIDIIIRRTLIYSAVSVVLALVYLGSVIVWQQLFSIFVSSQSPVAIVISTLIIAALFNPVRHRVQAIIDRRFFRQKFDAQQTLTAFALRARDEVELEVLAAELFDVVHRTMQPEHMSFWLRDIQKQPHANK
jgi:hypothetical protein